MIAITGASGGGKSTLVAALAAAGEQVQPEVGRDIVREQQATGGTTLPWVDPIAFRDLAFARSVAAYDYWYGRGRVFFDRTFLEALAYCRQIGQPVPNWMLAKVEGRRFHSKVFVCAPWRAIYRTDAERQHDFDYALKDYAANVAVYRAAGYDLVEVPQVSVEARVAFVLDMLK